MAVPTMEDDLGYSEAFGGGVVAEPRVEYQVYLDGGAAGSEELEELLVRCMGAVQGALEGYIWQLEAFILRSSLDQPAPPSASRAVPGKAPAAPTPHLWGSTRIGDNVDDEWFITFLLLEVTRRVPGTTARVWDEDGEFLLAEAAYHIPRWLKPETAPHRIFLRAGAVHIVPLPSSPADIGVLPVSPTLQESLALLASGKVATEAAPGVQAAVAGRVEGYPGRALKDLHRARVLVPCALAHVLKAEPQLVSAAVNAFYTRDLDDISAAQKAAHFPPQEMVPCLVTMTRCLYAQLRLQELGPPKGWPVPMPSEAAFGPAMLGMKLSAGFEILMARGGAMVTPAPDDAAAAVLEPTAPGGPVAPVAEPVGDPQWRAFKGSLERSGYFAGNIPGSAEYRRRLAEAVASFESSRSYSRAVESLVEPVDAIRAALVVPYSPAAYKEAGAGGAADDDAWLHVGAEEIEREIKIREQQMRPAAEEEQEVQREEASRAAAGMGGTGGGDEFSVEKLVSGLAEFVAAGAGAEGAEVPGGWGPAEGVGAGEGDALGAEGVSFDQDRFLGDLEEVLGIQGVFPRTRAEDEDSDDESDEGDEFYGVGGEGEADSDDESDEEGGGGGGSSGVAHVKAGAAEARLGGFMEEYLEALEEQLAGTALTDSFERAKPTPGEAGAGRAEGGAEGGAEDEEMAAVDVDLNLVTSMLASYQAQDGLAGPASNLAGLLGINLPDNEDKVGGMGGGSDSD